MKAESETTSILVFNTPKSCRECTLRTSLEANKFHCLAILPREEIKPYEEQKPCWCPLRPLPNKFNVDILSNCECEKASEFSKGFGCGWNSCIDEILEEDA